jgi:hypothetical protein
MNEVGSQRVPLRPVCTDREELAPFPAAQTQHATFTALRFPVLDVTGLVLACEVVESGCPGEVHQAEAQHNLSRGTPHCAGEHDATTSTVMCFPHCLHSSSRQASFPDALRRVHPITGWHLTTTTPPSSVRRAGILAPLLGSRCQRSLSVLS